MRKSPGLNDGDCGMRTYSVVRDRPGYFLHQRAFLWNDTPAGAAPARGTEFSFHRLPRWTPSHGDSQSSRPEAAERYKRLNIRHPR